MRVVLWFGYFLTVRGWLWHLPKREIRYPTASASPQTSWAIIRSHDMPSRDAFERAAREIHFGPFWTTFAGAVTRPELR